MAAPAGPAPEHIPYKITSQEKTMDFTPDGRFITVWKVGIESQVSHNHTFITIPDNEYTPAHVDQVAQQELDRIEGVHNLGPEPHPENLAAE